MQKQKKIYEKCNYFLRLLDLKSQFTKDVFSLHILLLL